MNMLKSLLEPTIIVLIIVVLLIINAWIFKRFKMIPSSGNITRSTISITVVLIGTVIFILSLPIDKSLKGQILSFLAIIISAGIALSSTTVLGNLIAGIMNNSMNRFRNGDLIKIGDLQGRVIKKSVFHTEIQLEDSNFVTVPNLYIATNPVKLIRKSNTVIFASVSLGYDVSHIKIEDSLKEAALSIGLKDPYVYITELGDYSVTYKIHGFLDDSNKFFSTTSQLNEKVMDVLHERGIEIVSPSFMNQRLVNEGDFIPKHHIEKVESQDESVPEDLIFDEAIKSEEIEKKKDVLKKIDKKKELLKEKLRGLKKDQEIERIKSSICRLDDIKERVEKSIEEQNKKENE